MISEEKRRNSERKPAPMWLPHHESHIESSRIRNLRYIPHFSPRTKQEFPLVVRLPYMGPWKRADFSLPTTCMQGPWKGLLFINYHFSSFLWWKIYWAPKGPSFLITLVFFLWWRTILWSPTKTFSCSLFPVDHISFSYPLPWLSMTSFVVTYLYNPTDLLLHILQPSG